MAGVKGRSGGHNRLTAEQLRLRGTYRKDRHRPPDPAPSWADDLLTDLPANAVVLEMARKTEAELASLEAVLYGPGPITDKKWAAGEVRRRRQLLASLLRQLAPVRREAEPPAPADDPFAVFEVVPGGRP